jgi:hypothetical protein|tara:strand:- start:3747 stop:3962 length:216 start_codon:yes stop_codon:yes gene_type:complete
MEDDKVDELFSKVIREHLNQKEFSDWAIGWLDGDDICDRAEEWDTGIKREQLKKLFEKYPKLKTKLVVEAL